MRSIRSIARRPLRTSVTSETLRVPFRTRRAAPRALYMHRPLPQCALRTFHTTSRVSDPKEDVFEASASVRPTTPQTHYSFFPKALPLGPPPKAPFDIDLSALKREFLQLQARAHPDMHPQVDKKRAEALSARINEAYKTLQNPLLRAQYLLSLSGIEVAEDETAKVDDPELLMEVLEAREQIEEAEREEDLVGMKKENDERIVESTRILAGAFKDNDMGLAKSETVKLRYWNNIKDSIDSWERGKPIVLQH